MIFVLGDCQREQLRVAVYGARRRDDVRLAVDCLYQQLQDAIELRRPVCATSGRCCRFEEFGHRLFVTTMELAAFCGSLAPETDTSGWDGTGCPFQRGRLCQVHAIRPFGCRVFFCDASSTGWQNEQYERFQSRLKRLHDDLNVPYFYVEWREALCTLHLAQPPILL
jgi:Fe-S-cluster containining protein